MASKRARFGAVKAVSAGSGPTIWQPRAASSPTTGAISSWSSWPRWPPSPAWGFSPQTQMRGSAIPKCSRRSCRTMSSVARSRARVMSAGTSRKATWVVIKRDAQCVRDQHHHRQRAAEALGEVLGVPGKGDAGIVDEGFLHRSGDHAGVRAVCDSRRRRDRGSAARTGHWRRPAGRQRRGGRALRPVPAARRLAPPLPTRRVRVRGCRCSDRALLRGCAGVRDRRWRAAAPRARARPA